MFIHIFAIMKLENLISQSKFDFEQEKLMINIIYSANLFNLLTTRLFKPFDLSPQQYNVLRILRGQKGNPISLMEIEKRMLDKSSNGSRLIDKLISKEFIIREASKEDRRRVEIIITSNGLSVLSKIDLILNKMNKRLENLVSCEEAQSANQVLDKIRDIKQFYE